MATNKVAGWKLAELGADIYRLADVHPEIEDSDDFGKMMFRLSKLSYRLLHGRERDQGNEESPVEAAP